ncbi:hypothetical protein ACOME3_004912 [Neoechinorhynchus agilis]
MQVNSQPIVEKFILPGRSLEAILNETKGSMDEPKGIIMIQMTGTPIDGELDIPSLARMPFEHPSETFSRMMNMVKEMLGSLVNVEGPMEQFNMKSKMVNATASEENLLNGEQITSDEESGGYYSPRSYLHQYNCPINTIDWDPEEYQETNLRYCPIHRCFHYD